MTLTAFGLAQPSKGSMAQPTTLAILGEVLDETSKSTLLNSAQSLAGLTTSSAKIKIWINVIHNR